MKKLMLLGALMLTLIGCKKEFTLTNLYTKQCMDVSAGSKDQGAALVQWPCHNKPNQVFTLKAAGKGHSLVSVDSGLCVDMIDHNQNQPSIGLHMYKCDGSRGQLFHAFFNKDKSVVIKPHLGHGKNCVRIENNSKKEGAAVIQWPCSTDNVDFVMGQTWIAQEVK